MKRPGGFDGSVHRPPEPPESVLPTLDESELVTPIVLPVTVEPPSETVPSPGVALEAAALPTAELVNEAEPDAPLGVRGARVRLKRAERERRARERRESRRFTAHRRRRRRVWAIVVASVVGLAVFVAVGVFTPIMAVRQIQVEGAQSVNIEDLQGALSRFEGVPLALVDDTEVHRALEPFPLIQRYSTQRIPPDTLLVRIEERSPVIALSRGGGEFELLDPAGVVLSRVTEVPAGVPLGNAELHDTSAAAFRAAAAVVRDMPEDLRAIITEVHATNAQDVRFILTTGTELVWGEASDTQRKAIVLRAMIASTGLPAMIDVSAPEAPVFR